MLISRISLLRVKVEIHQKIARNPTSLKNYVTKLRKKTLQLIGLEVEGYLMAQLSRQCYRVHKLVESSYV